MVELPRVGAPGQPHLPGSSHLPPKLPRIPFAGADALRAFASSLDRDEMPFDQVEAGAALFSRGRGEKPRAEYWYADSNLGKPTNMQTNNFNLKHHLQRPFASFPSSSAP